MHEQTAVFRRVLLAALLMAAGLVLVPAVPALAQATCSQNACHFTECHTVNGVQVCQGHWAGCYGFANNPANCICPVTGGSVCSFTYEVLTGNNEPTEEQLIEDGAAACHELLRLKLGADAGARLFARDSATARMVAVNRLVVSGVVKPRIPFDFKLEDTPSEAPSPRFKCELERREDGAWQERVLQVSEGAK